jgi:hypothetical protein
MIEACGFSATAESALAENGEEYLKNTLAWMLAESAATFTTNAYCTGKQYKYLQIHCFFPTEVTE